jgi:DNA adenine methylase
MPKSPYPWFGGKSAIADEIWKRLGDTPNYVEPFFGSGAVLLSRPGFTGENSWIETVNDKDGFVSNFWRAIKAEPEKVAEFADWPVNENDLHARHIWLVNRKDSLQERLEGDPDYYDAKIAGWWCWGLACWIGCGFCSGKGPWNTDGEKLINIRDGNAGQGVQRRLVHLNHQGQGVNSGFVNEANGDDPGTGECGLYAWFDALAARLSRVRVCCGDWSRVCTETPTTYQGLTAVFLDPPYSDLADRDSDIYAHDSESVAHEVRKWCIANGDNPLMRIALCGYIGEHELPGWECFRWKAQGGYGPQGNKKGKENRHKETIWFSPNRLKDEQKTLFQEIES